MGTSSSTARAYAAYELAELAARDLPRVLHTGFERTETPVVVQHDTFLEADYDDHVVVQQCTGELLVSSTALDMPNRGRSPTGNRSGTLRCHSVAGDHSRLQMRRQSKPYTLTK